MVEMEIAAYEPIPGVPHEAEFEKSLKKLRREHLPGHQSRGVSRNHAAQTVPAESTDATADEARPVVRFLPPPAAQHGSNAGPARLGNVYKKVTVTV